MLRKGLICGVILALAGCGGKSAATVQGKITLDGEPVALGNIVLLPASGTGPRAAAAIEQGAYVISADDKLVPGKYRVEIIDRTDVMLQIFDQRLDQQRREIQAIREALVARNDAAKNSAQPDDSSDSDTQPAPGAPDVSAPNVNR